MAQRGRKSTAALSVVTQGEVEALPRAQPPDELTRDQAQVWKTVTNSLPAEWFRPETLPLLAQYCRHVVNARRVAQLIENMEQSKDVEIDEYDKLLKMQDRESRGMTSLATKMRISQQATYDKSKKKPSGGRRPWES